MGTINRPASGHCITQLPQPPDAGLHTSRCPAISPAAVVSSISVPSQSFAPDQYRPAKLGDRHKTTNSCLSVYLSVFQSVFHSVSLFVALSIYPSMRPSFRPCIHASMHPCIHLSVCLSVYSSIYRCVYICISCLRKNCTHCFRQNFVKFP